jgi:phage shock protein PspC (stress-responsive transcriptional regulator)
MPRKKPKDQMDKHVKDFQEEVEAIGKKIEKEGEKYEKSFQSTFGIFGPLISSIVGLIIVMLIAMSFNMAAGYSEMSAFSVLGSFLNTNLVIFFLLFLFFSYAAYFSKTNHMAYLLFSPIVVATAIVSILWVCINVVQIANMYDGSLQIYAFSQQIEKVLAWIFWPLMLVGYLVLFLKLAFEKPSKTAKEKPVQRSLKSHLPSGKHRIYRSGKEKILGGVCGGLAEYLNMDPVVIRLLWVLLVLLWGAGIILYVIAWIIIPRNPHHKW